MPNIKIYDTATSQWVYAAVGKRGLQGETGPQGPQGATGGFSSTQTIQNLSAAYTIAANDAGKLFTNSAAVTVTVQGLSVGQQVDFVQTATSQITFTPGAGITLNSKSGNRKTAAQYSPVSIKCVEANTCILVGDLTA